MNDLDRARELGMTLDEFQALAGFDPLETYSELLSADEHEAYTGKKKKDEKKKPKVDKKLSKDPAGQSAGDIEFGEVELYEYIEKTKAGGPYSLHDEFTDVTGIGDGTAVPYETDTDVKNKTADELEHYWDRAITSPEDQALYYGFHIHSKDNVYGLHAHYPGGPLGGGHSHGAQNPLGYHTHRYNQEELIQFKFARPGVMLQLDGPHNHQQNAPDGKHVHQEENFGPASDRRAQKVEERNSKTDKN